jgi:hypothetical protein
MKPVMRVKVTEVTPGVSFQGTVELPSLVTTKLRKENGSTFYSTVSNLRQAAVAAAKKYNASLVFVEPKRLAAKRTSSR